MASAANMECALDEDIRGMRVYSVCYLDPKHVVPVAVEVIDALGDQEAILLTTSKRRFLVREIWDRHRLVARIASE